MISSVFMMFSLTAYANSSITFSLEANANKKVIADIAFVTSSINETRHAKISSIYGKEKGVTKWFAGNYVDIKHVTVTYGKEPKTRYYLESNCSVSNVENGSSIELVLDVHHKNHVISCEQW